MIKKIISTISTILICGVLVIGCSKADPIQDDLIKYSNTQMKPVIELQSKIAKDYSAIPISADNLKVLETGLKDVIIPESNDLVAKAKAIVPATAEVLKVHNEYVAAITEQNEAYTLMLKAIQNNDNDGLNASTAKMNDSSKKSDEFVAHFVALKKDHNVTDTGK